jgi:hypothetical protein
MTRPKALFYPPACQAGRLWTGTLYLDTTAPDKHPPRDYGLVLAGVYCVAEIQPVHACVQQWPVTGASPGNPAPAYNMRESMSQIETLRVADYRLGEGQRLRDDDLVSRLRQAQLRRHRGVLN